ncbi:MAG: LacI family DNA-binding transcriptional regulator, partial [Enterobacteriaceae bacterium]
MTNRSARKRRNTGRVTLSDVAKLAGVGSMTVSRALRTPDRVSEKLRDKINNAVEELGYLPNLAASSLASASSSTIAMIVPNLAEAGCAEAFAGLQQILQPAGYHILLGESQYYSDREQKLLETFLAYRPAGVILLGNEHTKATLEWLQQGDFPVVEMGAQRKEPIDLN